MLRGLRLLLVAACAGQLLSLLACAGVATEEIPTDPIAVLHWDRDDFRKREEILQGRVPGAPQREGVASADNVKRWLTAISGAESLRELSRYPGHLKLLNPRTGELTRLQGAPAGARPLAWSKDRKRLLFASTAGNQNFQIFEYDMETEEVRAVTYGKETHIAADYAPDGRIVFGGIELKTNPPAGRLYVSENSLALAKTEMDGVLAEAVRWSPKGDEVVFVIRQRVRGEKEGRPLLISMKLGEEEPRPRKLGAGRSPVFSPDGQWLIYSAPVADGWKLRRMRPDASARSPLGAGIRNEGYPAVSPDGRFVVYLAREGDLDRLFLRRMDGTGDRMLLADGGFGFPAW